ncbi:MAG: ribosome assembly cofactor RimP [Muribaculaceae bacterium]|nr:ribosome assembly cofactor RimP [Muribaculaceae bacterium]
MIDKDLLKSTVEEWLADTPMFLTDLTVSPDNTIVVEVDSDDSVDIEACAALTRRIEEVFDRDAEDYSLEVGSAGITSPFKVRRQYLRNIGNDVELLTRDGRKVRGTLVAVADGEADAPTVFTVETPVKVKEPGAKKPVVRMEPQQFSSDECKYVRYDLKF